MARPCVHDTASSARIAALASPLASRKLRSARFLSKSNCCAINSMSSLATWVECEAGRQAGGRGAVAWRALGGARKAATGKGQSPLGERLSKSGPAQPALCLCQCASPLRTVAAAHSAPVAPSTHLDRCQLLLPLPRRLLPLLLLRRQLHHRLSHSGRWQVHHDAMRRLGHKHPSTLRVAPAAAARSARCPRSLLLFLVGATSPAVPCSCPPPASSPSPRAAAGHSVAGRLLTSAAQDVQASKPAGDDWQGRSGGEGCIAPLRLPHHVCNLVQRSRRLAGLPCLRLLHLRGTAGGDGPSAGGGGSGRRPLGGGLRAFRRAVRLASLLSSLSPAMAGRGEFCERGSVWAGSTGGGWAGLGASIPSCSGRSALPGGQRLFAGLRSHADVAMHARPPAQGPATHIVPCAQRWTCCCGPEEREPHTMQGTMAGAQLQSVSAAHRHAHIADSVWQRARRRDKAAGRPPTTAAPLPPTCRSARAACRPSRPPAAAAAVGQRCRWWRR